MNKVILMGRLTRDPDIRYTAGEKPMVIGRYTLAVNRKYQRPGEPNADFLNCVAFKKSGEFAEKYLRKGIKIIVTGRLETGSYINKEGQKVYTTDIIVEDQEFAESKAASRGGDTSELGETGSTPSAASGDGFMNIPEGIDEELPFN